MKYTRSRTACGHESANDAKALCPLDPVDPIDIQMSIGNLRCPMDLMDIQMSIGNEMCPMYPMNMWKCPMDASLVRSIRTKVLHNRVGILHQWQKGLLATKFLPLNCIHLFYDERQSIYASFYSRTHFEFR